jgi:hypothetical protein
MIAKWLDELQKKGAIVDYNIDIDDVTKEYIVTYYTPREPLTFVVPFTIDPITNEVVFEGDTHEPC